MGAAGIEGLLLEVIAVLAAEIADRAERLGENLVGVGSPGHSTILSRNEGIHKEEESLFVGKPYVIIGINEGRWKRMIKDAKLLAEFKDELLKKECLDYVAGLRILDAMWEEARKLGVLPLKDPLEDIEVDIRVARILNHV